MLIAMKFVILKLKHREIFRDFLSEKKKPFKCMCKAYCPISSEFMQQDGRKKRTAKRLCVTNLTWLLLLLFVVIFTFH